MSAPSHIFWNTWGMPDSDTMHHGPSASVAVLRHSGQEKKREYFCPNAKSARITTLFQVTKTSFVLDIKANESNKKVFFKGPFIFLCFLKVLMVFHHIGLRAKFSCKFFFDKKLLLF